MFTILLLALIGLTDGEQVPCSGSCVDTWKKCSGSGLSGQRPCCSADAVCVHKTKSFGQCRPRKNAVPASWPGAKVLECEEPGVCKQEEIVMYWHFTTVLRKDRNDHLLEVLPYSDTNERFDGCPRRCLELQDCAAFEYDEGGDCYLFSKGVIGPGTRVQIDAEKGAIYFIKCFMPEPLCQPGTREVRKVNPTKPYFSLQDVHGTFESTSLEADSALESCINICRLQPAAGPCLGFALGPARFDGYKVRRECTPFYKAGAQADVYDDTTAQRWAHVPGSEVYSITECT